MKMYCITDNIETAVGLKLTGIETIVLQEKEEIDDEIEKVLQNKDIGILIVTEKIYELSKQSLNEIRKQLKTPLLVQI